MFAVKVRIQFLFFFLFLTIIKAFAEKMHDKAMGSGCWLPLSLPKIETQRNETPKSNNATMVITKILSLFIIVIIYML